MIRFKEIFTSIIQLYFIKKTAKTKEETTTKKCKTISEEIKLKRTLDIKNRKCKQKINI